MKAQDNKMALTLSWIAISCCVASIVVACNNVIRVPEVVVEMGTAVVFALLAIAWRRTD